MMADGHSGNRDETYDRLVRQEELILDVTERLTEALQETGVTKAELARRLGRTPGFVSQVLGGGRNLTLRTIADIAVALDLRPAFKLSPDWEIVAEESQWPDESRRGWTLQIPRSFGATSGSAARVQAPPVREHLAA